MLPDATPPTGPDDIDPALQRLCDGLERARSELAAAADFAKPAHFAKVLSYVQRLLKHPNGLTPLYAAAPTLDAAGIFQGSDYDHPEKLQPQLVAGCFNLGELNDVTLECLNQLRMLSIARAQFQHPGISAEQAEHFLRAVLALNLSRIFGTSDEASRTKPLEAEVQRLFQFIVEQVGYDRMLDELIEEIWRLLRQRPIKVDHITTMVTNVAVCMADPDVNLGSAGRGAERLTSALFNPTVASQDDPGLDIYRERLEQLDDAGIQEEAAGCARAMHDTGLVSAYHAVLLRFQLDRGVEAISQTLGLSSTGRDVLLTFHELIHTLIERAVYPETCQAIYGLACMLERGILYSPALGPSLWRQIDLQLDDSVRDTIACAYGTAQPAEVHLLAGVLGILGQPLGVGQGDNPTCQAARALSMWAYLQPDYLLQLLTWAARDCEVIMYFEGQQLSSASMVDGSMERLHLDLDPVSLILVPHLDRVYIHMGQLVEGRDEDPHFWINPEFHGRWVGHGFAIAVSIEDGRLCDYHDFIRGFHASYHPFYNGNKPVMYPQPAGIAATDSLGRFIGWHAITLQRVALDQNNEMRVYFYNPNNDSGQDWGNGVLVATSGTGESQGEASLPFAEFVSRLYLFHYDPLEQQDPAQVPDALCEEIEQMALASWAVDRA